MAEAKTKAQEPVKEVNQFDLGTYEEWKVDVTFKTEHDEDLNKVRVPVFNKEKLIKETIISHRHANILNEQSANSKIRYYQKEN